MGHLHSLSLTLWPHWGKRLLAFCQFPCIKFALNTLTLRGHLHLKAIASLKLRCFGMGLDWIWIGWDGMGWDAMLGDEVKISFAALPLHRPRELFSFEFSFLAMLAASRFLPWFPVLRWFFSAFVCFTAARFDWKIMHLPWQWAPPHFASKIQQKKKLKRKAKSADEPEIQAAK